MSVKYGGVAVRQMSYGRKWKLSLRRHWPLYVLLFVPLSWLIVFSYVPMYGVVMAFQDYSIKLGYFGSPFVGFKHFARFFSSGLIWQLLQNTVYLSLYGMAVGMTTPILLALMVNEIRQRHFQKATQMVAYLPYFISTVISVAIFAQFFSNNGTLNQIRALFGAGPVSLWGIKSTFRHLYVWSGVWTGVGFSSVIFTATLSKVDLELYEAAKLDGANRLQKIRHIDLPSIMPIITIQLIMSMSGILGVGFEKTYLMQTKLNLGVSEVISTYVYKASLLMSNYSFAQAVSIFNSVVALCFVVMANTIARKVSETSLW